MTLRQVFLLGICVAMVIPAGEAGLDAARAEATAAVTDRPCFGAAARSPRQQCVNPSLTRTVFPTPSEALLEPNAPCTPIGRANLLFPCRFGAGRTSLNDSAALIGDSHASHWRAAVDVVAKARGWPAISITRSGCPFIKARVIIPPSQDRTCRRWNRELMDWLVRHKEVSTIFLSERSGARYRRPRGASNFQTAVQGNLRLWRALPPSVKNVFVIRDTPRNTTAAADCVRRMVARHDRPGVLCARRRSKALHPDPAAVAARRTKSTRVHVLDMTRFFCDPGHCYPVVGGALVHKDTNHITAIFARTLGRFMLGMVDEAIKRPARSLIDSLLPDERALADCVLQERTLAVGAGGWDKIDASHLVRATECRRGLEQRAAEIKAAGLTGTFNRANRYAAIQEVLTVDG
jgi:SGNH domain (fused to AT3 domains)